MRNGALIGGICAMAITVVVAVTSPAGAQQYYGDGWYGHGMMGPGMMGPGMMGPGMMGPGMMGPGMMGPGMIGPGMMGPGYGMMGPGYIGCPGCGPGMSPGMMGYGMMGGYGPGGGWGPQQQPNLNLTVGLVKSNMERWVAMMGNPHIKIGNVVEKDADTIIADIVTTDKDALVQRFSVDRHTGFSHPVQ